MMSFQCKKYLEYKRSPRTWWEERRRRNYALYFLTVVFVSDAEASIVEQNSGRTFLDAPIIGVPAAAAALSNLSVEGLARGAWSGRAPEL